MFGAAINFGLYLLLVQRVLQVSNKILYVLLSVCTTLMQAFGNGFVGVRVQIPKSYVFQFPFKLTYAQTVG